MNKIILTKGLPASGKTTWAKAYLQSVKGKWKRINKDDLRSMLDNGQWSRDNEKFIITARDVLIREALTNGYSVIVDDTNLAPKHEEHIKQLFAVPVEIMDFTGVPLDECIKRDQKRSNYVGEKVIKQMYNQYLKPQPQIIERVEGLPDAIICDVDGTLALFDGNPYERDFLQDRVNTAVADILKSYCTYTHIIIVSGRKDKFKEQTILWLQQHNIPFNEIHMRQTLPEGVQDPKDSIVKTEIYKNHIEGKYNVRFVLDDRNQVVDMWRDLGLTCLQVNYGDF